jgi:hypothetical protein
MSNGEKSGSKKPHYTQRYKDKIATQQEEIERLKAQLAAKPEISVVGDVSAGPAVTGASSGEAADIDVVITTPEEALVMPDASRDCLGHITKDVQSVVLVSTMARIVLRKGDKNFDPAIRRIFSSTDTREPWGSCPWVIGDPTNPERDVRLKAQYAQWWVHRITRTKAESIWADDRVKTPTHTVIDPKKWKGFDSEVWEAVGETEPIEEFDPLRECVRIALMRIGNTFMDWGRRDRRHKFDLRVPNPYRNKLAEIDPRQMAHIPDGAMRHLGE